MATIIQLTFCEVCHKRIRENEAKTKFQDIIYCDLCFDEYLESIQPNDWNEFD